jgi:hypothetical protein
LTIPVKERSLQERSLHPASWVIPTLILEHIAIESGSRASGRRLTWQCVQEMTEFRFPKSQDSVPETLDFRFCGMTEALGL